MSVVAVEKAALTSEHNMCRAGQLGWHRVWDGGTRVGSKRTSSFQNPLKPHHVQGAGLGFLQKAELIPIHGLAFSWGRRSAIWRGPGFMGHPRERWGLFPGITSAFQ